MGENGGDGYNYYHYRISLTKEVLGFGLELNFQDVFGNSDFLRSDDVKQRFVFLVSRSF
jgi:hypothetical protein